MTEQQRILRAYQTRKIRPQAGATFFCYENPAQVCRVHERYQETLRLLRISGFHPLSELRILDIGCGDGNMLRQFVQWGAEPERLAGIELRPEPVQRGVHLSPNISVLCGDASSLPWEDACFDLVCQHTVFTSILDSQMRQVVASEMVRVVRPGGAILWYDFMYNNPTNPDVRGVKASEIEALFPGFDMHLSRITLAPPIARRLPEGMLHLLYPLVAAITMLSTHYLGVLIKPGSTQSETGV